MTSPYAPPDRAALAELERVIQHLMDELVTWRRRCLKAEGALQGLSGQGGLVPGDDLVQVKDRLLEVERDNLDLRSRVDRARDMVDQLQQRLLFLADDSEETAP